MISFRMAGKRGRPLTYTNEMADEICCRLAAGESLMAICVGDGMPPESTVRLWVIDDHSGFAAKYARARDVGIEHEFDEMIAVARDGSRDKLTGEVDHEHIQRSKLIVDTMKWRLSKMAPKRYGDRVELAGAADAPLEVRHRVEFVPPPKARE